MKRKLFETAASRPEWLVAHCAALLAVSTTCRGVELRIFAGRTWTSSDASPPFAAARPQPAIGPSHSTETRWPRSPACSNVHGPSAAASPSTTFSPPARSGSSIPHARRKVGAPHGANSLMAEARVRCHADGGRRSHVAADARPLQPRTHGREALGAGKLESGLMGGPSATSQPESRKAN
jgi:hypothetical protein